MKLLLPETLTDFSGVLQAISPPSVPSKLKFSRFQGLPKLRTGLTPAPNAFSPLEICVPCRNVPILVPFFTYGVLLFGSLPRPMFVRLITPTPATPSGLSIVLTRMIVGHTCRC